mmetsp:Transcript_12916/g.20015  ORF Transcript_12916/g.20015 Transcript_12916/m.20015 type:complete len:153 (+) Transcript_12916:336-794(+)
MQQRIPGAEYRATKRTSVFHKVELSNMDFGKVPVFKKTPEQMNEILPLLRGNFLTKSLQSEEIERIAQSMKPQSFEKGEVIIRYGDTGNLYYILAQGKVSVKIYKKGTFPDDPELESKIAVQKPLDAGTGFGELALMYNDKRSATIVADEQC